jgi:hypothetical protein
MTVANTVAKPLDGIGHAPTTLEYRPRAPTRLDGPGRFAQNYGSEGWGFESLRARLRARHPYPQVTGLTPHPLNSASVSSGLILDLLASSAALLRRSA